MPRFHIWKLTGMRVGHIKDLRICDGSATDLLWTATVTQGQGFRCKDCTKDWSFDCYFYLQTLSMSIHSRSIADPAMFWGIFVGAEASRMKGMPQGHPGWVYRHSQMSYGRDMEELQILRSVKTLRKNQAV